MLWPIERSDWMGISSSSIAGLGKLIYIAQTKQPMGMGFCLLSIGCLDYVDIPNSLIVKHPNSNWKFMGNCFNLIMMMIMEWSRVPSIMFPFRSPTWNLCPIEEY